MALKLKIIHGSTRPGRKGLPVTRWIEGLARDVDGFDVEFVDLADVGLPLLDEAAHPAMQNYEHAHTKSWSNIVSDADAFVFVIPEYNYFPPAVVVNAVQTLLKEWSKKPAGIVSYGGVSGGLRATQVLRTLLANVDMVPLTKTVPLPFFATHIEGETFTPTEPMSEGAGIMLAELLRWAEALKPMRG
ncbi:NADPH-dependent FMN reductase [Pelagovum pacificum]|uniref:NAD(P)H-dependent oxidoreductase n=1 Tax=Pelagovum pacificum TaxID=2588711 RepID=A0A5C5GA06_9RHOB|nr:NAD(P)H-dependent oxidoreductase [Pelagovum pacificum]QQA42531.1 NAD(P)H-dependent oxidoreductase [Pelagovum pacificum]TNY31615.1 NAD(P)H-dependent oxidoreductase [Pelagovum pacificum]